MNKPQSQKSMVRRRQTKSRRPDPAKGWDKARPKTKQDRMDVLLGCSSKCFLEPFAKPHPKYPICARLDAPAGQKCKISCKGLLAAYRRARQQKRNDLAKKALNIAKYHKCSWYVRNHTKAGRKTKKSRKIRRNRKARKIRKTKRSRKSKKSRKSRKTKKTHRDLTKDQLYKMAKRIQRRTHDKSSLSKKTKRGLVIYINRHR